MYKMQKTITEEVQLKQRVMDRFEKKIAPYFNEMRDKILAYFESLGYSIRPSDIIINYHFGGDAIYRDWHIQNITVALAKEISAEIDENDMHECVDMMDSITSKHHIPCKHGPYMYYPDELNAHPMYRYEVPGNMPINAYGNFK